MAEMQERGEIVEEGGVARAKRKRGPWFVVFIIALVVFVLSIAALGIIGWGYLQGQQEYDDLAKNVVVTVDDGEADVGETMSIDWEALREANPDTVAWVYVPDTRINYPVVQAKDNDWYLLHDFHGEEGWPVHVGAIFLDYQNKPDFSDPANFIYGHHMNDGSMFAGIEDFADQQMFDAHRAAYVILPDRTYKLRTFALVHCYDWDPIVQIEFVDKAERAAYVQDKLDRSIVACEDAPEAKKVKQIFALATCDSFFATNMRYVLYCTVEEVIGVPSDKLGDDIVTNVGAEVAEATGASEEEGEGEGSEGEPEGESDENSGDSGDGAGEGEGEEAPAEEGAVEETAE